jgi:3-hydroxyisobutyrate dehydrogenase
MNGGIGYVGLGDQGAPIARRLLAAGIPVTLWARRPETLAPFRGSAARTAATLGELGRAEPLAGVCVTDDAAVLDVVTDELLEGLGPGGTVIVQSTVLPSTCRALGRRAASFGVDVIDAPVSGGADAAREGRLAVMVGGAAEAVRRCAPVLQHLGRVQHLGGLGSGQVAKLCSNAVYTANLAVLLHAVDAAADLGLDRTTMLQVLRMSSANSFVAGRIGKLADPGRVDHYAAVLAKDVGLYAVMCEQEGVDPRGLPALAEQGLAALRRYSAAGPWAAP